MGENVVENGNCTSPPGTRTSDGQQEISGKADSVKSNMNQGTIASIPKAEADGKDITLRAKKRYDELLLQLQIFCSVQTENHFKDAKHYDEKCQQFEQISTWLFVVGGIFGSWTLVADQFSKPNGGQASGNGEQTSGNGKQSSGNGKQTSGIGKQTRSNVEQTFGNIRQAIANGEQTSGIGKQTSAIWMKILAGIKRKPIGTTVGVGGLFVSGVLQYASQGTATLLPSYQIRADGHRKVFFGFSGLTQKVKATRIELRKPDMTSDTLCSKYTKHIEEYQALGQVIVVRDLTIQEFKASQMKKAIVEQETKYLEEWKVEN